MSSFLQSPEWEEFQKGVGRKTWHIGGTLAIRHDLPGGFNYLYCPRPKLVTSNWLLDIRKVAREGKAIFLKIDPQGNFQFPVPNSRYSNTLQPRKTVVLDLQKSEEELLRATHEKTRYNIRLAEKRGVQITNHPEGKAIEDLRQSPDKSQIINPFEKFWSLLQETVKRDQFYAHGRQYYEKLLQVRSEGFSNELFFAEYQGKILAAALVNFYKPSETATYLHGASSREHKEVMAPHLLHWRIVREAKRRGFKYYDLWGIDEKRWPGLTRFKLGWGGKTAEYPEALDVVYRPIFYKAYQIFRLFL